MRASSASKGMSLSDFFTHSFDEQGNHSGHQLGNSIAVLRQLYNLGARYITLTHTCHNAFADSCGTLPEKWGGLRYASSRIQSFTHTNVLMYLSKSTWVPPHRRNEPHRHARRPQSYVRQYCASSSKIFQGTRHLVTLFCPRSPFA